MTGWLLNFLLINNGYHMAHHLYPKVHWADLPKKHKEIEDKIHPDLIENDFAWWLLKTYVLSIFISKYRSKQMRFENETEQPKLVESAA